MRSEAKYNDYVSENKPTAPITIIDKVIEEYLLGKIKALDIQIEHIRNLRYRQDRPTVRSATSRLIELKLEQNKASVSRLCRLLLKKGNVCILLEVESVRSPLSGEYILHSSDSVMNIQTDRTFKIVDFINKFEDLHVYCDDFDFMIRVYGGKGNQLYEKDLKEGLIVDHFKGGLYEIIGVATHTEDGTKLVAYKSLDGFNPPKIYTRPLDMFLEEVECDGKIMPRFSK